MFPNLPRTMREEFCRTMRMVVGSRSQTRIKSLQTFTSNELVKLILSCPQWADEGFSAVGV